MVSGGPRAGAGRVPDENALRRDRPSDQATWTTLPREGRKGGAPAWPLTNRPTRRERAFWNRLWKTPQAVQWERDRQHEQVARYVCKQIEADEPGAVAAICTLSLRMAEDLGLTYAGMMRLHWRISRDQVAVQRQLHVEDGEKPDPSAESSRNRLRSVPGGAG